MEEYEIDTEDEMVVDSEDNAASNKLTVKARKVKRASGKRKLCHAKQGFKKEFLDLFPWVEEDPEDSNFAICRACNKKMKAHRANLEMHQKTKTHLKYISGCDDIEDDEPVKPVKPAAKMHIPKPQMGQAAALDNNITIFAESHMDSAHHAITNLLDKLVEKYHENRLENLSVQNKVMMEAQAQRASRLRAEKQRKYEIYAQQEMYKQQQLEVHQKFKQQQHQARVNARAEEWVAKVRAVEQQLVFTRREYEKKVRLLDQQLKFIQ